MSIKCLKINLYSVFTFLKYGPSELFSYSVSDHHNFDLSLQQDFDRGLDTTSSHSEKDHQRFHGMTTFNKSIGKEDFQSQMETRRQWKQKVCEISNKSDKVLLSPLEPLEQMVYYV